MCAGVRACVRACVCVRVRVRVRVCVCVLTNITGLYESATFTRHRIHIFYNERK